MLVVADEGANPAHVAADLLSQAEHGPDSQVRMNKKEEEGRRQEKGGRGRRRKRKEKTGVVCVHATQGADRR